MASASWFNAVLVLNLASYANVLTGIKVAPSWRSPSTWQAALPGEADRYIIASFPQDFKVSYAKLPDPTWRPLVVGLKDPTAIAVDQRNNRLFVADSATNTVYWYQLEVQQPSKFLVTDGVQHVAVHNMTAHGLAASPTGDLYISGRAAVKPPLTSKEAIYRREGHDLTADTAKVDRLWTAGDGTWVPIMLQTGVPDPSARMSPSTPEMFVPGPIGVDMFSVYWGNSIKRNASAVAKAAATVPAPLSGSGSSLPAPKVRASVIANNVDFVTSMAVTAAGVFYAGQPAEGAAGIFGVPFGCQEEGKSDCVKRVADISNAAALAWDGEATLYVADKSTGSVLSLAATRVARHALAKVAAARGIKSMAVLTVPSSATSCAPALAMLLAALLVSFL
eukprot:TRINITY_DN44107_c0_g1_i1.p1 TRINITY_DN44107_c0_g1~~TRINITY_DN44107_c0_g1_i1.p1  ORF type:complete len:405 (-),score=77.08 TRINITY_DN44107_c0_g1_i1:73-1248(-)